MAISLTKTWNAYKSPLWYQGSSADTTYQNRNVIFQLKQFLVTTLGWTIIGSCNKTSYNFGGADLWAAYTDLNWGGYYSPYTYSWIVLKHPLYDYQIVLACRGLYDSNDKFSVFGSWLGYTAGGLTGPTDPGDAITHIDGMSGDESWNRLLGQNWNKDSRWVAVRSTDGQCTRIFYVCCETAGPVQQTGGWSVLGCLFFDVPTLPSVVYPQWKWPMVVGAWGMSNASNQTCASYGWTNDDSRLYVKTTVGWCKVICATEFYGGGCLGENIYWPIDDYGSTDETRGWFLTPIKYVGVTTRLGGRYGAPPDMWFGPNGCPIGETYSTNGVDRNLIQLGNLVVPWDGSNLNLETA